MKLIVAEKPSVAGAIAAALGATSKAGGYYEGDGWIVSWCLGHLVSPLDAGGYEERFRMWRFEDLPILPEPFRYVLIAGKEDTFQNLKQLRSTVTVSVVQQRCVHTENCIGEEAIPNFV